MLFIRIASIIVLWSDILAVVAAVEVEVEEVVVAVVVVVGGVVKVVMAVAEAHLSTSNLAIHLAYLPITTFYSSHPVIDLFKLYLYDTTITIPSHSPPPPPPPPPPHSPPPRCLCLCLCPLDVNRRSGVSASPCDPQKGESFPFSVS